MYARAAVFACALSFAVPARAAEPERDRFMSIGAGVHLLSTLGEVCEHDGDVVACSIMSPFAGGDVSAHLWLLDWFAVGARVAGSKDLDGSETDSSTGASTDRDEWLWRLSAEARLDPPLFPRGMWLGAEIGAAWLVDSLDEFDAAGGEIASESVTQSGLLIGAALGWDFHLSEALLLGLDLRAQLIALGSDPPELDAGVSAREFGDSPWISLGARFTYQW